MTIIELQNEFLSETKRILKSLPGVKVDHNDTDYGKISSYYKLADGRRVRVSDHARFYDRCASDIYIQAGMGITEPANKFFVRAKGEKRFVNTPQEAINFILEN